MVLFEVTAACYTTAVMVIAHAALSDRDYGRINEEFLSSKSNSRTACAGCHIDGHFHSNEFVQRSCVVKELFDCGHKARSSRPHGSTNLRFVEASCAVAQLVVVLYYSLSLSLSQISQIIADNCTSQ